MRWQKAYDVEKPRVVVSARTRTSPSPPRLCCCLVIHELVEVAGRELFTEAVEGGEALFIRLNLRVHHVLFLLRGLRARLREK